MILAICVIVMIVCGVVVVALSPRGTRKSSGVSLAVAVVVVMLLGAAFLFIMRFFLT